MALATQADAPSQPGGRPQATDPQATGPQQPGLPSARPPLPVVVATIVWALAALSALLAWFLLYAFSLSGLEEASSQHALYAQLRTEIAQEIAPPFSASTPTDNIGLGKPVAFLRVPQAGINAVVLEGTTSGVLEQGPGLLADTPLPGQPGVSEIFGRQTMFGGPFRHLAILRAGDLIQVTTGEGTFTYVVDDLRYSGQPVPTPPPAPSRLILITAVGSGWHGAGGLDQVLYADASLRGKPGGSAPGLPTALPASQLLMQGDPGVLFPLVLWLQLLLLTVLAVAWIRAHWGGWQTWLIGAPAILAVLWVVSETAFQLLPNLL